jgi:hypothetical protein
VHDVPNDQGGKISVKWTPSYRDVGPDYPIDHYTVWRQVPPAFALGALQRAARGVAADGAVAPWQRGAIRTSVQNSQIYYWEYLGTLFAHGFPGYSFTVETLSDSIAGSNPYTAVMVEAEQQFDQSFWTSAPDSGYSADNLAPAGPAAFTGIYNAGTTALMWGSNAEPDFALYRLHRGLTPAFVPNASNLVVAKSTANYVDVAGQPYYYKLAAQDVHGNLSPYAFVLPTGSVSVDGAHAPSVLFLAPPSPNPAHGGTAIRFGLPSEGRIALAIFDQQGRRIRELASGASTAGDHAVLWDGRDNEGGTAASGLYFVRLEAAGRALTRRLVLIQ